MDTADKEPNSQPSITRRSFIKAVIASGVTVSSVGYLFRGGEAAQIQPGLPGAVERLVTLTVNGQKRPVDVVKQETLDRKSVV